MPIGRLSVKQYVNTVMCNGLWDSADEIVMNYIIIKITYKLYKKKFLLTIKHRIITIYFFKKKKKKNNGFIFKNILIIISPKSQSCRYLSKHHPCMIIILSLRRNV